MFDDPSDELPVDLAADQSQDFAPVVVTAMLIKEGDQTVDVERLLNVKSMHDVSRAKILQKRAMDESVTIRAKIAEKEVAFSQLPHQSVCRGTRLVETEFVTQIGFDQPGERIPVDDVPGQTLGSVLHGECNAAENRRLGSQVHLAP